MIEDAETVRRAVAFLTLLRSDTLGARLRRHVHAHPGISIAVGVYSLLGLAIALLFWLKPLLLLTLNDSLGHFDYTLPAAVGGFRLPIRYVLLLGFVKSHPWLLDSWVAAHIESVKRHLLQSDAFVSRTTYIPLPVDVNGTVHQALTPSLLQSATRRPRWRLLVWGDEGGLGKTTLALQMALWALEDDVSRRLCRTHILLPVVLETDVPAAVLASVAGLKREIRRRLQEAISAAYPLSDELLEELLRQRRILVICDGLSEMDRVGIDTPPALTDPDSPMNALIVTGRTKERFGQDVTIGPRRISKDRLVPFVTAYVEHVGGLLMSDVEIFDVCRRLADILSDRGGVTPLLARLYVEHLVRATTGTVQLDELPRNVPALILAYLNDTNRARRTEDPANPVVHKVARIVAWDCIKRDLRPRMANRDRIAARIRREGVSIDVLTYLEVRLKIVRTVSPAETDLQFVMDPLAEYLGAMHALEIVKSSHRLWRALIRKLQGIPGGPQRVRGFVIALRDSCESGERQAPDFAREYLDQCLRESDSSNAAQPT